MMLRVTRYDRFIVWPVPCDGNEDNVYREVFLNKHPFSLLDALSPGS